MIESLLLSTTLTAVAAFKRALTKTGLVLAWTCCLIITYFGGITAFSILAATLFFTVLSDKIAGKRADPKGIRRKSGARDHVRVFCNVGVGTLAMTLCGITGEHSFYLIYAAVMAGSLADSLASKFGPLAKTLPFDICTLRRTEVGISGGVTLLGLGSSLIGGVLIGCIYTLGSSFNFTNGVLIAGCGLVGSVADSVLGSLAQVKYKCPICKMVTERENHCGMPTTAIRGVRWVNNDMVNFLNNVTVFLLALMIFG